MGSSIDKKKKKLTIILCESELECIPKSIQNHPQIRSFLKKRNEPAHQILLDSSFHHAAMKKLSDANRRGRPDIIHRCALFALDSWANSNGSLNLFIHTRNDEVIWVNPKTRLPRQYHRFKGLMEKLFKEGKITTPDDCLLTIESKSLNQLIHDQTGDIILFSEKGKSSTITDVMNSFGESGLTLVIGGFPHGDFHKAYNLIDTKVSIEKKSFPASYLLAKAVIHYEQVHLDHK